jgi:hypothetical protein
LNRNYLAALTSKHVKESRQPDIDFSVLHEAVAHDIWGPATLRGRSLMLCGEQGGYAFSGDVPQLHKQTKKTVKAKRGKQSGRSLSLPLTADSHECFEGL